MPVIIGVNETVIKELKYIWKQYQERIQRIFYRKQFY
jgi:hypothetical protein